MAYECVCELIVLVPAARPQAVERVYFGQLQAAQEESVRLAKDCLEYHKK